MLDLRCYGCYSTGKSHATTKPHHHTNTASDSADELNDLTYELLKLDTLKMNTSIHTPTDEDMLTAAA